MSIEQKRIMRIKEIKARVGLPNSTIYDHIKRQLFPKPIKLGERISGWLESEITAIINARIAGNSNDEIKDLVIKLEAARKKTGGKV